MMMIEMIMMMIEMIMTMIEMIMMMIDMIIMMIEMIIMMIEMIMMMIEMIMSYCAVIQYLISITFSSHYAVKTWIFNKRKKCFINFFSVQRRHFFSIKLFRSDQIR